MKRQEILNQCLFDYFKGNTEGLLGLVDTFKHDFGVDWYRMYMFGVYTLLLPRRAVIQLLRETYFDTEIL